MSPKRPRLIAPSGDIPSKPSCTSSNISHATNKHPCDECHRSYRNPSSLGRHKREGHKSLDHFSCNHCGDSFTRPYSLKVHVQKKRCAILKDKLSHQRPSFLSNYSPATSRIGQSLLSSSHDELSSDATSVSLTSAVLEHDTLEMFQSPAKSGDQPILTSTESSPAPSSAHGPATAEDGSMDGVSDDDRDNAEEDKGSESDTGTGRSNKDHESDSDAVVEANDDDEIEDTWPTCACWRCSDGARRQLSLDRAKSHLSDLNRRFLTESAYAYPDETSWQFIRRFLNDSAYANPGETLWRHMWRFFNDSAYAEPDETLRQQVSLQRHERDRSRCTTRRPPPRLPLPPAFDYPPPQNLEDLIAQQQRRIAQHQRRSRVMQSFRSTHSKFTRNMPEFMNVVVPTEAWDSLIEGHRVNPKQAWKDGVAAAQRLLSGILPRELHSVLGVAQIASAIRYAMDDIDSPAVSEEKFLVDLGRWMQLLPSDSHVAFDYYAHMLWDNRPPSDPAWEETQDQEKLRYFQGYLADMLSYTGSSPPEIAKIESILPPPDATLCPTIFATDHPMSFSVAPKEVLPGVENVLETPNHKPSIVG